MIVNILDSKKSILNKFISEIRDVSVQKDSMRFRRNIERMGEIFAYEISKHLKYTNSTVTTPLGECVINLVESQPVIATVLRAGLPLHQGVLNYFDQAENAFVSAYRKHVTGDEFEVHVDYMAGPSLKGKTLIISFLKSKLIPFLVFVKNISKTNLLFNTDITSKNSLCP